MREALITNNVMTADEVTAMKANLEALFSSLKFPSPDEFPHAARTKCWLGGSELGDELPGFRGIPARALTGSVGSHP